jgi:hypothetical protein
MRKFLFLFSCLGLALIPAGGRSAAQSPLTQATFTSVTGIVTLIGPNGQAPQTVVLGSTAQEGDKVLVEKDSSATLKMFDGSQLQIGAESSVLLSKLRKPSWRDKLLAFQLLVGQVTAQVKKLASSNSSFEIEAGGVVCGVRGTKFTMDYNLADRTLDLDVLEGTVYTQANGGPETDYAAGQTGHFKNLPGFHPNGPPPEAGPLTNPALLDLNDHFQLGNLTNNENNLGEAQNHLFFHLQVGPGETVP